MKGHRTVPITIILISSEFHRVFKGNTDPLVASWLNSIDVAAETNVLNSDLNGDIINTQNSGGVNDNGTDSRADIYKNDNRYSEMQTEGQARGVDNQLNQGRVGRLSKISADRRSDSRVETRTLETLLNDKTFINLSAFVGNEVSYSLQNDLFEQYQKDTRITEEDYDFSAVITYDMLTNPDNELRGLFADEIEAYFNVEKSSDTDITGRVIEKPILDKLKNTVVKNENGQLIPVYHATNKAFDKFEIGDIGFHFGSYAQAYKRAQDQEYDNPTFIKAYLNIKNPLIMEEDFSGWNAFQIAKKLKDMGILTEEEALEYWTTSRKDKQKSNASLTKLLQNKNYDGVVYNNNSESVNGQSYIVFDDSQIIRVDDGSSSTDVTGIDEQNMHDSDKNSSANEDVTTLYESVTKTPENEKNISDTASDKTTNSQKRNELFKKLTDSIPLLENDPVVYEATGYEFEVGEKKLSQQVYEYFESLDGVVHRDNFGDVAINDKGVDSSIAHGMGRAKAIAFASVPAVIEKGRQIDFVKNWKGRNYDSYVFAAPIQIGAQKAFVGVVVTKSETDNRYYLHEVSDNEGNIIIIKKDDASFKSKSKADDDNSSLGETSSNNIISQDENIVNDSIRNNAENDALEDEITKVSNAIEKTLRPEILSNNDLMSMLADKFGDDGISGLADEIIARHEKGESIGDFESLFADGGIKVIEALNGNINADETIFKTEQVDKNTERVIGVESYEFEGTDERRAVRNGRGLGWNIGERSGRNGERVQERAGKIEREIYKGKTTKREIKAKSLTIAYDEVSSEDWSDDMTNLAKKNKNEYGLKTVYFAGEAYVLETKDTGNAFIYKGTLYLSMNNSQHSIEELADHEITHNYEGTAAHNKFLSALTSRLSKSELAAIRRNFREKYSGILAEKRKQFKNTIPEKEWQAYCNNYIDCEILANINAGTLEFADRFAEEIKTFRSEIRSYSVEESVPAATSESKAENTAAEYAESIDAGGDVKLALFPGGVFPPFNKSHSDANERASRWAHNDEIETGAQRIFFYKDTPYLVEKFDSMELGYLVVEKISKKSLSRYERNMIEYEERDKDDRNNRPQSGRKDVVSNNEPNQGFGENRRGSSDDNNGSDKHSGETAEVQKVDREQDGNRSTEHDRSRNNQHSIENREDEVKFNLSTKDSDYMKAVEAAKDTGQYTDKEYRDFGWARANDILNAGQNADYRSKFADAKSGRVKFNKSKIGEYIIPVSNIYDSDREGINNVLVFAKGTITNPIITSVIEIYEHDETALADIRRFIYGLERRGISAKSGPVIGRYYATDFGNEYEKQNITDGENNNGNRYGERSSGETSSAEGRNGEDVKFSFVGVNTDFWEEWLNKAREYGVIPKGENPARDIDVPKKISDRGRFYVLR